MEKKFLIGLTGSFGSGCSALRKVLEKHREIISFKLSEEVRKETKKKGLDVNERENLQKVGNILRKDKGTNYLAVKALEKAKKENENIIVFHGIRNAGEVKEFRKYPNFFLVAVDCSKDNRWKRLKRIYDGDKRGFERDDKRDKNEGLEYGQQVLQCVEDADILFINNEYYLTESKLNTELETLFKPHLELITGEKLRNPSEEETMMTAAASLALKSHCIKRRVGAVLCDSSGYIISAAYNEVPKAQETCFEKYRMCYRDHVRKNFSETLVSHFKFCPLCSKELNLDGVKCKSCQSDLSYLIPPYKALDKCRSLHAEETTILKAAHYQLKDSTLYSTTFPCLQCAKRILNADIKYVIYIDPYPEEESIKMLEKGGVKTKKFEGVKAQAYYKLFYPSQKFLEEEIKEKLDAFKKEEGEYGDMS